MAMARPLGAIEAVVIGASAGGIDALIALLRTDEVEAARLTFALHRLPQFARAAVNLARKFPVADAIADGGIAVPLHPGMNNADVNVVIDSLRRHAQWAMA